MLYREDPDSELTIYTGLLNAPMPGGLHLKRALQDRS